MKALTILPIVYTTKIVAKLRPINAANEYNATLACDAVMEFILNPKKNTIASGAKITIHFIAPVKKNDIRAGDELTNALVTMLMTTAKNMLLYTLNIALLMSLADLYIDAVFSYI
jgi:hypothetical protein